MFSLKLNNYEEVVGHGSDAQLYGSENSNYLI